MTDLRSQYLDRIAETESRIARACEKAQRDIDEITLVAVSKTKSSQEVDAIFSAGLKHFGENKAQELIEKSQACNQEIIWHFIGNIQTNKLKKIAQYASVIHSVDSRKQLEIISNVEKSSEIFLQLSCDGNPSRGGVVVEEIKELYKYSQELNVDVTGIMVVPPIQEDPKQHFINAQHLSEELGLTKLSMGMSHDFETAIECGSTIIRVGSALFGARS